MIWNKSDDKKSYDEGMKGYTSIGGMKRRSATKKVGQTASKVGGFFGRAAKSKPVKTIGKGLVGTAKGVSWAGKKTYKGLTSKPAKKTYKAVGDYLYGKPKRSVTKKRRTTRAQQPQIIYLQPPPAPKRRRVVKKRDSFW